MLNPRYLLTILAIILGTLAVFAMTAHAATDPVAQVDAATSTGWDLVAQFGPIWGGMLLAHGIAAKALERNKDEHWLAEGRTLALIVAGVGLLAAVLQAHLGGGSWAGVSRSAVVEG